MQIERKKPKSKKLNADRGAPPAMECLQDDLLYIICCHLRDDPLSIIRLSGTCKRFYQFSRSDKCWQRIGLAKSYKHFLHTSVQHFSCHFDEIVKTKEILAHNENFSFQMLRQSRESSAFVSTQSSRQLRGCIKAAECLLSGIRVTEMLVSIKNTLELSISYNTRTRRFWKVLHPIMETLDFQILNINCSVEEEGFVSSACVVNGVKMLFSCYESSLLSMFIENEPGTWIEISSNDNRYGPFLLLLNEKTLAFEELETTSLNKMMNLSHLERIEDLLAVLFVIGCGGGFNTISKKVLYYGLLSLSRMDAEYTGYLPYQSVDPVEDASNEDWIASVSKKSMCVECGCWRNLIGKCPECEASKNK